MKLLYGRILRWSFFTVTLLSLTGAQDCEIWIRSEDVPRKGNFSTPHYPAHYDDNTQCTYRFIGRSNERVQIKFYDFKLDGFPNRLAGVYTGCTNDFMDIYTQVDHQDHDILELPLQGRYCGNGDMELPHLLMSKKNILYVTFDSDNDGKTQTGFLGSYEFIDSAPYKLGTPAQFGACGWSIQSSEHPNGRILAPEYPAMYSDDLNCYFLLTGDPGDRIKLEFHDFDLYSGGDHCPYDYVEVYDGSSNSDTQIGIYCGQMANLTVFSTGPNMYIHFRTQSGRPDEVYDFYNPPIEMRGFNATYVFSKDFVDLSFLREGSRHILGTECDSRVLSSGESEGVIVSPNFPGPAPVGVSCYYYIDGLIDNQNKEKVILNFNELYLPREDSRSQCAYTPYISTYLFGQTPTSSAPDSYICDTNKPLEIISHNPRLSLKFNTTGMMVSEPVGFQATYKFVMDFAIGGTPAPAATRSSSCHFLYRSSSQISGKINSPRFPSTYPNDITCTYELIAEPEQFILVSFSAFEVEHVGSNAAECLGDRLSAVSVVKSATNTTAAVIIPSGSYCGSANPGPLVSEWDSEKMIISFVSDSDVTMQGFQASYEFITRDKRFSCGENITTGGSGVIVPPNYPLKYQTRTVCDWFIYRRKLDAQIKIKFEQFDIEGSAEEGCQGAVLRVYKSDENVVDYEMCGQEPEADNIISENGFIRIKFISSSKSFGGKTGFKLSWVEVMHAEGLVSSDAETTPNATLKTLPTRCPWFQCANALICVPESAVCNGRDDCMDNSDEVNCAGRLDHNSILYIAIGVAVVLLLVALFAICFCVRRNDKHNKANSRKSSSKSSRADPELTHDRLSKAPMLPQSQSTQSNFNPYEKDPTTHTFNPYDRDPQTSTFQPPVSFQSTFNPQLSRYHDSYNDRIGPPQTYHPYDREPTSTLSSKYSGYTTRNSELGRQDMDSCLTSL